MRGAVSPPLRRACRQCGHAGHAFALLALCSLVLVVAGVRAVQQYTHARLHGPHQLPRVPVTHSALSLLRVLLNGAWAKACPHLLHLGKSICDAWTANPFSWPFSCPVEPRWLSAGLAQLLPLLAAPLDTMRERLMRATLARPPAAAAAAAKESPDGCHRGGGIHRGGSVASLSAAFLSPPGSTAVPCASAQAETQALRGGAGTSVPMGK